MVVELRDRLREASANAAEQWHVVMQQYKDSNYQDAELKFAEESLWRFRCQAVAYASLADIRHWQIKFGLTIPGLVIPDEIFDAK